MIKNIGCDLVRIARIQKSMDTYGDRFFKKIFSASEIAAAPIHHKKRYTYFANRFAAKEAFAKALGTGLGKHIKFNEIEVLNHASGQPYIKYPERLGELRAHLSISDDDSHSLAFVVIESDG